jgi:rod shape determining protein RodA
MKTTEIPITFREFLKRFDYILVFTTLAVVALGALLVASATHADPSASRDIYKQLTWIVLGVIAAVAVAVVHYQRVRAFAIPLYLINAFFLGLVSYAGYSAQGAQRWIELGSFRLQPSEFAKVALIITFAAYLGERKGNVHGSQVITSFVHLIFPMGLILLQPDLGTAMVLLAIWLGMLLVSGAKIRHLLVIVLVLALVFFLALNFHFLKNYQVRRLLVFVNPDLDPAGAGYNLLQSKIAIGSGRMNGKGLFSGTQGRLNFIPSHHTDFIFAVLGEELGFVGTSLLLVLYFILVSRAIRIASTAKDMFGALVAAGISVMLLFQVLVNVGMTMGIMPITGIPLPLVSYGGSSLLANMMAMGLLFGISVRRFK